MVKAAVGIMYCRNLIRKLLLIFAADSTKLKKIKRSLLIKIIFILVLLLPFSADIANLKNIRLSLLVTATFK